MVKSECGDTKSPNRSPWHHKFGNALAMISFGLAITVVAVVEAWIWPHILVRPDELAPYILGGFSIGIVVFLWMSLASLIAMWLGRPRGRWVAFGWASLTLLGIYPMVWNYRQVDPPLAPTFNTRFLDFGLLLTTAIWIASMLPRVFRYGIGASLLFAIVLIPGVSAIYLGLQQRFALPLWLFGVQRLDEGMTFVNSLLYAVYIGFGFGLFLGVLALFGMVTLSSDTEE